ncbi:hypothetical protein WNZ15_08945 [Roseibium sp. AS2]|uniref:hypothetical protein n=1 Tax=Roseibium sp. AS2 TaxID=3135781 RepID=UPI0031776A6E
MTENSTELQNEPTPSPEYPICVKADSKIDICGVEYTAVTWDRHGCVLARVDNPLDVERRLNSELQAFVAWRILFEARGTDVPEAYDDDVDCSDLLYMSHQAVEMVQIRQFICGRLRKMGIDAHSTYSDAALKDAIAALCSEWVENYAENSPGSKFGFPNSVARFGHPKPCTVRGWLLRYEPADLDGMAHIIVHCFSNIAKTAAAFRSVS